MNTAILLTAALAGLTLHAAEPGRDEVIRKNLEAHGGLDKIKAIKTLKCTGKAVFAGGQIEAPLVWRSKRPLRYRTEIQIQGQQMVEAFDGKTKWIIGGGNPNPQPSDPEGSRSAAESSDIVESPLVNFKEKGNTVDLLGKEDVDGSPAYKFKATLESGSVRMVYVDAKSFLTVKTVTKVKELEAESKLSNYKRVDGVMIAFTNSIKINRQPIMQMIYDKVEVNVPLDDSLFTMPVKSK
jgi:hypothetical protein